MKVFLLFSLIFASTQCISSSVHLQIPFKEDHDSKFIFELEQFDDEKMLDCTGEIYVRNLTNQLVFNFRQVEIHRNINVQKSKVKAATALPIIMKVGDTKLFDPKDYDDWDWIDPRIIVKIMKYTNIDDNGRVVEESWEVSDLECPVQSNIDALNPGSAKLQLKYDLEECIDSVEDEIVVQHHRIIKFTIDQRLQIIKRIEYHYQKTNKEFDQQNNAQIVFQGFVKY